MSSDSVQAGQWIRERRRLLNLRREDLLPATRVALSTLARVEKGEPANRSTIVGVGKALRMDESAAESLAEWHAGAITRQEFLSRYNGGVGRSAEEFLRQRGIAVVNGLPVTVSLFSGLPDARWMVAKPGRGTPVLGEVTAGGMVESIVFDNGDEPQRVPIYYPDVARLYGLRISGESMAPEYRSGEFLICRDATPDELEDGEDAVVQCDGGVDGASTFKRCFFLGDGRVRMIALNPAFEALEVKFETIVRVGKIMGVYRERPQKKALK